MHIVGAGNSAGQAALFFSTHARSVTILCRGDGLEKSMSRYLIDQLATRSNIRTRFGAEVAAVHGELSLEAIEVRDSATSETTRLESGGLFIFIGADAQTGWLPPEIALDRNGYVLTGSDMRETGRWELDRDPYLLETSVPGIFACGDVRFGPIKRVAAAVGEGSMAIAFVHQFLREVLELQQLLVRRQRQELHELVAAQRHPLEQRARQVGAALLVEPVVVADLAADLLQLLAGQRAHQLGRDRPAVVEHLAVVDPLPHLRA